MKRLCTMAVVAVVAAVGWLGVTGCESTSTAESVIVVSPSDVSLTTSNRTVMFTVSSSGTNTALVLPLHWSVGDAGLGSVTAQQGLTAVYHSSGRVGNQTVTVRDQADSEGLALVRQE